MYYDGTKLLSLKDADGAKPEIYLCVGNRTAGKTVFFKRLCLNNFIQGKGKFVLLYRFNYELSSCADMFFRDIRPLFFENGELTARPVAKGLFYELYYNEKSCGFAIALSNADPLKKYSSYFNEVENVFLDEFQSETNHYCPDEIRKFQSIHVTIARGKGKQYRYVRTILASNSVTMLNPYYKSMGIHKMLRNDTKFLRGHGWVMEQTFNESASKSLSSSGFSKAFDDGYSDYASQNVYLNDNDSFIEHIKGKCRYIATIKHGSKYYAIREFFEDGIVYVNDSPDMTYPVKLTFKADDHEQNALMVSKSTFVMQYLKKVFEHGQLRFNNLDSKNIIFDILSI